MREAFAWDQKKNLANQLRHGISFEEARALFTSGQDFLELFDAEHSGAEERFLAIGWIQSGLVVVVWTEPEDDLIRIISARRATKREHALYQEYMEHRHDGYS